MNRFVSFAWLLIALLLLGGAPGCGQPEVVAESASPVCPACKDQTKVMPLLGLEYVSHECPECHTSTRYADLPYDTVHYCERCRKIVEECPQCREAGR